jgi:hypothetical protein
MTEKIRPYDFLSDQELADLVGEAANLRFRLAMLNPGEVRQTMVDHGCPPHAATMQVEHKAFRVYAAKFALDVQDAERGDRAAKERVEYVTQRWAEMRAKQPEV